MHEALPAALLAVLLAVLVAGSLGAARAEAQPLRWQVVADGQVVDDLALRPIPADSVETAVRAALEALQRRGHYLAALDSARVDTTARPPTGTLYVQRGPEVVLGTLRLEGARQVPEDELRRLMDTRPGRVLDPATLEADLDVLLGRYERAGLPLAQIRVTDARLLDGEDDPTLALTLAIDEGRPLVLERVEVVGAERTSAAYVERVTGLRPGMAMTTYDPAEVRRRLEETALFREVGEPELFLDAEGAAIVRVPLEEDAPGTFDLVLGYLPATTPEGSGTVVGNGHLELRNLFGGGRVVGLQLDRRPGQVSSVDARLADPFIAGWPLRGEVAFEGLQQDSTYGKQAYQAELGYRFEGGLEAFGTLSRELTKPGQAGVALGRDGRQRIPRAEALFYGLGVRYTAVDNRLNPRRGLLVETNVERGDKERIARVRKPASQDTTTERTSLSQERLQATLRAFVPTFRRQVLVLGVDAGVLLSSVYDRSDLFRFGGASSLRGYNEDRFEGNAVGRALAEYRYQLDRTSFAFLFFDLGYVETPVLEEQPARQGFYPGYGFGIQYRTDLGLVRASYAISPDEGPANGRVHLGLSFGL